MQMCRLMVRAASMARAATGVHRRRSRSVALLPVERLALLQHHALAPGGWSRGEPSPAMRAMAMSSSRILVSAVPWLLRRGSWLTMSTSCADGVHAVAQHLRGFAARGRHQLVAHDQQAEVVAWQKALHHHLVAVAFCDGGVGGFQLGAW